MTKFKVVRVVTFERRAMKPLLEVKPHHGLIFFVRLIFFEH